MKTQKKILPFVAIAISIVTVCDGRKKSSIQTFQIITQGGTGSNAYFVLGQNVTTNIPGEPSTYICLPGPNYCTASGECADIHEIGSQLHMLKSDVISLGSGYFSDL